MWTVQVLIVIIHDAGKEDSINKLADDTLCCSVSGFSGISVLSKNLAYFAP